MIWNGKYAYTALNYGIIDRINVAFWLGIGFIAGPGNFSGALMEWFCVLIQLKTPTKNLNELLSRALRMKRRYGEQKDIATR